MRTLYNILFTFFFALASPYYFMRLRRRGNWIAGFGQRQALGGDGIKHALGAGAGVKDGADETLCRR